MKKSLYLLCGMLLTLLFAGTDQSFAQLPLNQFKALNDSAYQAVPEYKSGNNYQKDAILFMDMVADTHPYYIKPERRTEWFAKKAALLEQCKDLESDEAFADALIATLGQLHDKHTDIATVKRIQEGRKAVNEKGTEDAVEEIDMTQVMSPHDSFYDYKLFPEESICYLQFNKCMNAPDYPFSQFLDDMFAKMEESHIKTLVVDAQYNSGGSSQLCDQLLEHLYSVDKMKNFTTYLRFSDLMAAYNPRIAQVKKNWEGDGHTDELYQMPAAKIPNDYQQPKLYEGQVVFVMGQKTFSSAGMLMTLARDNHIGTIIGSNSNFPPSHYGEVLPYRLPNTGVLGSISCKFFARPDTATVDDTFMAPDYEIDLNDKAATWQFIVQHFSADSNIACSPKQQTDEIKILVEIRPEVNYVTHLYTLAELGFSDPVYTAKYGHTLPGAAIDTLQKYKEYLTFGQGENGPLSWFFFMVAQEKFADSDALKTIMDSYREEALRLGVPADEMAIPTAIANVFVENYDHYLREVYPQAKADMEERRQMLSRKMQEQSFVKDWERVTGYKWNRGDYHWLLYRAGQNGPSYNNLNDSTNTVWYNQDIDYQLAMFSHEFGIFLMQDSIDPIVEEMKVYTRKLDSDRDLTYVPWSAFESLACWYNCKIAGRKTADYQAFGEADVKTFCQIFDRLSKDGISNPAELYRKGIIEYLK